MSLRERLLVITSTFPARADDWRPAFVRDLATREAVDFDVTVLTPRVRDVVQDPSNLDIKRFPYFFKRLEGLADDAILPTLRTQKWRWVEVPFFLGSMCLQAILIARRIRPAVVHAHWVIPGGLAAYCNFLVNRTPYIVTLHGADVHALNGDVATRLKCRILHHARAIVPVSMEAQLAVMSIEPRLSELMAEVVPMGVEEPELLAIERRRSQFLFVGRLAEKKGLDVAIRAVARVPDAMLEVVGGGPSQAAAEELIAELQLEDRVRFLGRLPRCDVLQKMREASGLLIPSVIARDGDREGTPVVLAEALSLGLPVIASRIGGVTDVIRHRENGLLVEPGDPESLAMAMEDLMYDATLDAIGENGRAGFRSSPMNLEWTADRYLKLLNGLTER